MRYGPLALANGAPADRPPGAAGAPLCRFGRAWAEQATTAGPRTPTTPGQMASDLGSSGRPCGTRTHNQWIKSPLLCQRARDIRCCPVQPTLAQYRYPLVARVEPPPSVLSGPAPSAECQAVWPSAGRAESPPPPGVLGGTRLSRQSTPWRRQASAQLPGREARRRPARRQLPPRPPRTTPCTYPRSG